MSGALAGETGATGATGSALTPEQRLARFVVGFPAADVPPEAHRILRHIVLAVAGTALAGVAEDGIAPLRALLLALAVVAAPIDPESAEADDTARIASVTRIPRPCRPAASTPGAKIANSSPPSRATRSPVRVAARRPSAQRTRTSSPARWPRGSP